MMKNVFFSEMLIQLVKDRPQIWSNTRSPAIEHRLQREESWNEIGREIAGEEEWDGFSNGERSAYVTQLKKRWRNMRDNFVKSVQRPPDDVRRKYFYEDKLKFLLDDDQHKMKQSEPEEDPLTCDESNGEPAFKVFKATSSDDGDLTSFVKIENCQSEMDYEPAEEIEQHVVLPLPKEGVVSGTAPEPKQERPKTILNLELGNQNRKKPQSSPDEFERELLKFLKAQTEQPKPPPPQPPPSPAEMASDPDAMFLLSHLPFIKTLNPADRLDFRVKFMQFLQSFINETQKCH